MKVNGSAMNMISAIAGSIELVVEKILSGQERLRYPICLKGKRACPPEDVGGVWGYENFLKAIHDPEHEEHEDYLNWIGGEFDPEAFDLDEVNDRLQRMGRGWSTEYLDPWSMHNIELASKEFDLDPILVTQPAGRPAAGG